MRKAWRRAVNLRSFAAVMVAGLGLAAGAGRADPALDYVLNCQGCHLPDGRGAPGRVPPLKDHVARFLALPEGRAFLIQVPGVARSALSDERIAALMNWLVARFDPEHLPADFRPYTAGEVAALRANPRAQVSARRAELLARIAAIEGAAGDGRD
ncbi:MAG: hypothetical protein KatS3mg119_1271 [Rhodothalassiaceae bacterium]|nr:MAG: hypothetical protein KatS3mg119_1271 [Rhodothalassiaceae bacterium]